MSVLRSKVIRDLTTNRPRSLLIIISVAVGVMAFGLMQIGGTVLNENLHNSFSASNPANSVLVVSAFQDGLVENVRSLPYVDFAEARTITQALLETQPDKWVSLEMNTISDFDHLKINKINPATGAQIPPPENSILLEQSLRDIAEIGNTVRVKTLNGKIYNLKVAGFANDLSIVPTSVGLVAYGYITPETALVLDLPTDYNRLYVKMKGSPDRSSIQKNVTALVKHIEKNNVSVFSAPVREPGKQLLGDNLNSVLFILNSLGTLTLFLSAFLVTAVMFAVMNQQIKQIGILKSLGARSSQTMFLYFQQVILYGLLALVLAIPLSAVGGYFMAHGVGDSMNMVVSDFFVPLHTVALQVLSALLIPLLAALIPILNGSRITIREAISDYISNDSSRMSFTGRILSFFGEISQVFNLSVRNTFRRPGRLALNFATLILAGAMFIGVIGIRQSLRVAVTNIQNDTKYDVDVDFTKPYSKTDFEKKASRVEGVTHIEAWSISDGRIAFADNTLSGSIVLIGVPNDTSTTQPTAVAGRFLLPADKYSIFINSDTLALADLKTGSKVRLRIGTQERDWTVVGVGARGFFPVAYVHYDDLVSQTGTDGLANRLVVQSSSSDPAAQTKLQARLLVELDDAGYEISSSHTTTELKVSTAAQMDTLSVLLMAMVILIAIVGGLGLAITMSLNVMERTREIGIMRSMGAKNGVIRRLVLVESLIIALMSWLIAIPFSIPLAIFLGNSLGVSLLATPLDYIFSIPAVLIWLGLIILIAILASLIPAQNAVWLTIRDTLVYE